MRDEGWKGKEALNPDLEFWKVVSEPGDPSEAKVGDAIYIEGPKTRQIAIVTRHWPVGGGKFNIEFRAPRPNEVHPVPTLTIVTSNDPGNAKYES